VHTHKNHLVHTSTITTPKKFLKNRTIILEKCWCSASRSYFLGNNKDTVIRFIDTHYSSMKTTTSLMAIAAAVAMVGGVSTITSLMTIQQAEAAQCTDLLGNPSNFCYCYNTFSNTNHCFVNKGDCQKEQRSNPFATSGCFRQK
jgi:hypothetical protein